VIIQQRKEKYNESEAYTKITEQSINKVDMEVLAT